MKQPLSFFSLVAIVAGGACLAQIDKAAALQQTGAAQPPASAPVPQTAGRGPGRGGFGGPIELGPDDKPAFPDPPAGFNVKRDNIPRGELTAIEYDSKALGTRRRMRVYTPPGYSTARKYPVLYLLHGIGGTDTEWTQSCHANVIIDNLLAEGKIQPMVMVFPDGNSSRTAADLAAGGRGTNAAAGANPEARGPGAPAGAPGVGRGRGMNMEAWLTPFENDLLKDIIPYIDSHYSVDTTSIAALRPEPQSLEPPGSHQRQRPRGRRQDPLLSGKSCHPEKPSPSAESFFGQQIDDVRVARLRPLLSMPRSRAADEYRCYALIE